MDQPRSRLAQQQAANPGVAEQVEDVGIFGPRAHPVPLRGHIGKEAEVPERRQRCLKPDAIAPERPLRIDRTVLHPAPAPFLVRTGHECRIGVPFGERRCPHRLRLRAGDFVTAVALVFFTVPGIDQAPVRPGLSDDRGERAHAANFAPTLARARGPAIICAPTARTCSSVTASSRATISAGSINSRSRRSRVAR